MLPDEDPGQHSVGLCWKKRKEIKHWELSWLQLQNNHLLNWSTSGTSCHFLFSQVSSSAYFCCLVGLIFSWVDFWNAALPENRFKTLVSKSCVWAVCVPAIKTFLQQRTERQKGYKAARTNSEEPWVPEQLRRSSDDKHHLHGFVKASLSVPVWRGTRWEELNPAGHIAAQQFCWLCGCAKDKAAYPQPALCSCPHRSGFSLRAPQSKTFCVPIKIRVSRFSFDAFDASKRASDQLLITSEISSQLLSQPSVWLSRYWCDLKKQKKQKHNSKICCNHFR